MNLENEQPEKKVLQVGQPQPGKTPKEYELGGNTIIDHTQAENTQEEIPVQPIKKEGREHLKKNFTNNENANPGNE